MFSHSASPRAGLTLGLSTLLHAFTHAYQALLIPLYILMYKDLGLSGVWAVTLIVTIYNAVYFVFSYPAGILADRLNRRMLLGIGLIGNALAFALMGATHQYWALLLLGIMAGLFGTLFHPAANSLASAHYPKSPGMALGIMGIGSGIGFFFGSQYAGWRADTVGRGWLGLSNWQVPCVEIGLAGIIVGVLFLLVAREVVHEHGRRPKLAMGPRLRRRTLAIALIIGWRDFAGVATSTLLSIYLQRAHAFDAGRTGWILGAMGLISVVATPLAVWASAGRRRLPGLAAVMVGGGLVLIIVPHVSMAWLLTVLGIFQVFHLGSYAIGEVSLVERVEGVLRGRVIGLYLTICGTMGALAPWVVGWWTDRMGERAKVASSYGAPFAALGAMMIFASLAVRLIAGIGAAQELTTSQALSIAEAEAAV